MVEMWKIVFAALSLAAVEAGVVDYSYTTPATTTYVPPPMTTAYSPPPPVTYGYTTPQPTTYSTTQPPSQYGYSSPPPLPPLPPLPPQYGYSSTPPPSYIQPEYSTTPQPYQICKPYYETTQVDKCENYNDKVCYTTQQESCNDVPDQNCNPIVTMTQVRQCFNVTELKCSLKEDVQYETVQAVFTVQKCHTVNERVCDTVFETEDMNKDAFQCITVNNSICSNVDNTLYDKTCRTTTKFDCNKDYGYGFDQGSSNSGGGNGGSGYEDSCRRSQNTQCYNSPRVVTYEVCTKTPQQMCEKLINTAPYPKEKQFCHNEEKKVCELEQRTQPKQIKKYVYTTNCKQVPRTVCNNASIKKLIANCAPVTRKTCSYTPYEKCEDVPKEYCYKVPKKTMKTKCYTQGYGSTGDSEDSYV